MIATGALLGAGVGLGIWITVRAISPRPAPLGQALAALDRHPQPPSWLALGRLEVLPLRDVRVLWLLRCERGLDVRGGHRARRLGVRLRSVF